MIQTKIQKVHIILQTDTFLALVKFSALDDTIQPESKPKQ
jgi:hypothetical protein